MLPKLGTFMSGDFMSGDFLTWIRVVDIELLSFLYMHLYSRLIKTTFLAFNHCPALKRPMNHPLTMYLLRHQNNTAISQRVVYFVNAAKFCRPSSFFGFSFSSLSIYETINSLFFFCAYIK